ncbi:MAG: CAP domain-containing protein [Elainella sp. C42_A2020_010]|nr:CAP domain-containing protein [Elainella sp. C42_A2020_010]
MAAPAIATTAVLLLTGCETLREALPNLPLPTAPPSSQPQPAPAQSTSTAEMETQVREQINAIRQAESLAPLRHNDKLAQVARDYSRRMAEESFFSHTSPDGDSAADRVRSAGVFYLMVGENLFTSTNIAQPVPAAVEGWMNSPGHRENILRSEYRETGIGVWRQGDTYYFTQLFMRSL